MSADRPDLGVLALRLARAIASAEEPILAAHGVSMWEYVVLGALESAPAPTQAQLAEATGRDQTRLIPILDALEARGLIDRSPHPDDRRRRGVALTDGGRTLVSRCRSEIRALEARLLADVDPDDASTFVRVLRGLTARRGP